LSYRLASNLDAMATVYRKTPKGQTEIETRGHRLPPRVRTTLILVNGQRNDDELAKLSPADASATLASLLAEGFIEAVATVEPRASPRVPAIPVAAPTTTTPAGADNDAAAFMQRRRDAIRALNDQLGPGAEALAIRVERCTTWEELRPALEAAVKTLRLARGASAATEYNARFVDAPF
jgi:hypothetical protein